MGELDEPAGAAAKAVFSSLGEVRSVASPEAAEAVKLFSNVHRGVELAHTNQFALIYEATGVDVTEVRKAGSRGFARFSRARPGPLAAHA